MYFPDVKMACYKCAKLVNRGRLQVALMMVVWYLEAIIQVTVYDLLSVSFSLFCDY